MKIDRKVVIHGKHVEIFMSLVREIKMSVIKLRDKCPGFSVFICTFDSKKDLNIFLSKLYSATGIKLKTV